MNSMRATAATNALSHEPDIAKVQEWLGHANVFTTRLYDRRKIQPEDSPTFRVRYESGPRYAVQRSGRNMPILNHEVLYALGHWPMVNTTSSMNLNRFT